MFKNLNKYLLINFPLAWNMRFPIFLVVSLILNILYFTIGYAHKIELYDFYDRNAYEEVFVYFFNVILIILIIIIWLVYYFRNNAFKSFYNIDKWHLTKEFLMVFTISSLLAITTYSFKVGENLKFKHLSKNIDYEKGKKIINQAQCFFVFNQEQFELYNCLDSLKYRDSLYQIRSLIPDSCDMYLNQNNNSKYREITSAADEAISQTSDYLESSNSYYEHKEREKEYSFLYYCGGSIESYNENLIYFENAKKWIIQNKKDSIKNSITVYLKLLESVGGKYSFNLKNLMSTIHAGKHKGMFNINSSMYNYNENLRPNITNSIETDENLIEHNFLENTLEKFQYFNKNSIFLNNYFMIYLYFSFCFTMMVCLFRFSRLKPFLISIFAAGLISLFVSFIIALTNIEFIGYLILILIVLISIIFSILSIYKNNSKSLSIISLHFFCFGYMFFIPICVAIFNRFTYEIKKCINHVNVIVRPEHPLRIWFQMNFEIVLIINLFLCFLVFVFIILPLLKKWQANSSE